MRYQVKDLGHERARNFFGGGRGNSGLAWKRFSGQSPNQQQETNDRMVRRSPAQIGEMRRIDTLFKVLRPTEEEQPRAQDVKVRGTSGLSFPLLGEMALVGATL
ncbi:hypothetical protein OGR47_18885 (plasmid) [Methylocystis sp. MJC1]|uniref:hypothetical protein n=1 Tax=Methylocystis sp. MJC1 TaxID=2654282 RepID=UPI001C1E2D84|nr:hypothetical protein [Methylocystis sp. MJC1]MBU6529024.1 hypothetical protein [Methylocystis sp. MJC1]UZX13969.1 hypothetical protein OGR47_18885 [Methylocystis sp. MJC1]